MTKFVLLDSNLLIGAFDHDPNNQQHIAAKATVINLMTQVSQGAAKIAITPLIRYEVLRGVKNISFADMQNLLDDFEEFEISDKEANLAASLFHQAKTMQKSLDRHSFDVFHYAVAQTRQLELQTQNTRDFSTIEDVAKQMNL